MPIAQDRSRQKSGKNYGIEHCLNLDTSKELFPDQKDILKLRPICEEGNSISECDRERIEENMSCKKSYFKCNELRLRDEQSFLGKNLIFDPGKCSSIDDSSIEYDYSDVEVSCVLDCGKRCHSAGFDKETQAEGKGLYSIKRDVAGERCENCHYRKCRDRSRTTRGMLVYGQALKSRQECKERQKKNGKDDFDVPNLTLRRMLTKMRHAHTKDCCDAFREQGCEKFDDCMNTRGRFSYKGECKGKRRFCGDWCNSCTGVDLREECESRIQKLNQPTHLLRQSKTYKCLRHAKSAESSHKEEESLNKNDYLSKGLDHHLPKTQQDLYHQSKHTDEIFTTREKKVVPDSYEEMPIANESPEQFSDGTYKVSLTKFSNLNNSDSLTNFPRGNEKMKEILDSGPSWCLYRDNMSRDTLSEALPCKIIPERTIKMRSRRTRMNRFRRSSWIKTYIHAVMEKSRNEMVGLMVMGPKGPEFFSKSFRKTGCYIPFRKSRSFPEESTKSCEMSLCFEPKDTLCKSDPGRKPSFPSNELISPEENIKIEEKIANFDKNASEIVKSKEEKFLQSLAKDQHQNHSPTVKVINNSVTKDGEDKTEIKQFQNAEDVKKMKCPPFHWIPSEFLSSRVPKSVRKSEKPVPRDAFAFNTESKTISENLSEHAKQSTHLNEKKESSSKLEKKFPPNAIEKTNLSPWNMRIDDADVKETREIQNATGEVDVAQNYNFGDHKRNECGLPSKDVMFPDEKTKDNPIDSDKQSEKTDVLTKTKYMKASPRPNSIQTLCEKSDPQVPLKHSEKCHEAKPSSKTDNRETEQILRNMLKDLVKNGCALSEKESENLQKIFREARYETKMNALEVFDSTTSDEQIKAPETKEDQSSCFSKVRNKNEEANETKEIAECFPSKFRNRHATCRRANHCKKEVEDVGFGYHSDGIRKKDRKPRRGRDETSQMKFLKRLRSKQRNTINKKPCTSCMTLEKDKTKLLREVLPSMAAENEATHLKQLKKYIYHFIDKVELKESSSAEAKTKKEVKSKPRESTSSESSEVSTEAANILNLVSNPFKRITSDMTIDIAKLTNALARESSSKSPKNFPTSFKNRRDHGEGTEEDSSLPFPVSSSETGMGIRVSTRRGRSRETGIGMETEEVPRRKDTDKEDRGDDMEPTYLKQLKKMRNDHLGNIIMEVRKLNELLRFLDLCNRLKL